MQPESGDATHAPASSVPGDSADFDAVFALVYDQLRAIAHQRLLRHGRGGRDETLRTTALVNEAYLRLSGTPAARWNDRAHFLALASRAMRYVLVDHARARMAEKRGGAGAPLSLDAVQLAADDRAAELLELDDALEQLRRHSDRLGRVVEYRFFGGLAFEEIAELTGLSVPTVKRDWTRARAWLHRSLGAA